MAEDVLIRFRADISGLVGEIAEILQLFNQLSTAFERIGQTASQRKAETFGKTLKTDAEQSARRIDQLTERLRALNELQNRIRREGLGRVGVPRDFPAFGDFQPHKRPTAEAIDLAALETQRQLTAEIAQFRSLTVTAEAQALGLAKQNAVVFEEMLATSSRRKLVEEQINRVLSGQVAENLVARRLQELERVEAGLERTKAQIEQEAFAQVGKRGGRLEKERIGIENQLASVLDRRVRVEKQIEAAATASADAQGQGLTAATKAQGQLAALQERRARLIREEAQLQTRLQRVGGPATTLEEVLRRTGGADLISGINKQLADVQQKQLAALTGGVRAVAPEYQALAVQLLRISGILDRHQGSEERRAALMQRQLELVQQISAVQRQAPSRDLPQVQSPEQLRQGVIQGLPALERTMVAAFDDIGRRFQATLQFAVSGALIFGVQQFFREFLENAIEVERAFADIESALEFDLGDLGLDRGTRAFKSEVEDLRRTVIGFTREFNVLPTIANETAFKMVARFNDMGNAMAATRAQLLATRVSTISQDETLRALTATAEGFAEATLSANNGLSLQQRLFEHERVAAEGYAKALDDAVFIQQRFGVDVEDTLEGVARAAQTFGQLGFTLPETAATVSALVFTLGQTGANVAERLNRAFGGITDPQIRNDLLQLAAASDVLTLSFSDFDTGAQAIQAIDRQIQQLERLEPGTFASLRDILGQRRETETVAAFFGTRDLRQAIESSLGGAAGAAERRFGFLQATMEERINSILASFEELAQNFERIGGLNPFKAFLVSADFVLERANDILLLFGSIVEGLDRIGEFVTTPFAALFDKEPIDDFGTTLRNVLGTLLSVGIALKTIRAGVASFQLLRAGATNLAGGPIAQAGLIPIRTPLDNRAAMSAIETAGFTLLNFTTLVRQSGREQQSIFRGLGTVSKDLAKAMVGAAAAAAQFALAGLSRVPLLGPLLVRADAAGKLMLTTFGKIAGIAGLVAIAFAEISQGARIGAEALRSLGTAREEAELEGRRRAITEPFANALEQELFTAQSELDLLVAKSSENVRGEFSTAFAAMFPVLDEEMTKQAGGFAQAAVTTFVGALAGLAGFEIVGEELVPGSEEWWEAVLLAARKRFLEAQIAVTEASIRESQAATGSRGPRSRGGALLQAADRVARAVLEAETPEELDAATLRWEKVKLAADEFAIAAGVAIGVIETTVDGLDKKLQQVMRDLEFGRITPDQAIADIDAQIAELQTFIAFLEGKVSSGFPQYQEELDKAREALDERFTKRIETLSASFERFRRAIERGPDELVNLRRTIDAIADQIDQLRDIGVNEGDQRLVELQEDRADKQLELARLTRERALSIARINVATARTYKEWLQAMRELQNALLGAAIEAAIRGDPALPQINADFLAAIREVQDVQFEDARRKAVASARLGSPIRSNLARINADILGLQIALRDERLKPGEIAELRLQIAELLAERAEEQAATVAAAARLQAGVNNRIASLTTEVAILVAQLSLTARLFGTQSKEFFQVSLQIEQAKAEVAAALLSLEDLRRRLGSDLTDDFEQAILELHLISDKLQAPDLGELEKAQLALEKKQAELAAARAFFNEELLNLRFLFETGDIGQAGYIAALRALLAQVDTTTQQGKEIFLEIQGLIDSLTGDISDMAFNVPTAIRLPTIFEVRRALTADQLGVNYMDNREQSITVEVSGIQALEDVIAAITSAIGDGVTVSSTRFATGGAGIVLNGFR